MQTLLALKSKSSAKQRDAHAKGKLVVKKDPLRYARISDPVEDLVDRLELRNNASAADFLHEDKTHKYLKKTVCPNCQESKCTKGIALMSKTQISNIRCGI